MRHLVTGASGQLGSHLVRELTRQGRDVRAWSGSRTGALDGVLLQPLNLMDSQTTSTALDEAAPNVVLHCAALATIAECYARPEAARRINTDASTALAALCAKRGIRFVQVSTDLVFDGAVGNYSENDPACPLSIYGLSKAAGEMGILAFPGVVVARVSLLFGPSLLGRPSFFDQQLDALRAGKPIRLFEDEWRTPLSLPTAARALIALAASDVTGLLHIGGPERMSRLEMGQRLARLLGLGAEAIVPSRREDVPAPEPRPRDVSLNSGQWRALFPNVPWPGWDEAMASCLTR